MHYLARSTCLDRSIGDIVQAPPSQSPPLCYAIINGHTLWIDRRLLPPLESLINRNASAAIVCLPNKRSNFE